MPQLRKGFSKMTALKDIRKLVDEQAEDEGLWFDTETTSEAYLQTHLRRLHALIEHYTVSENT